MSRSTNKSLRGAILVLGLIWFGPAPVQAGRLAVDSETPIAFFTNIASHLLRSQLNLELHRLELYPTNQYGPAVQRLLQVAANLYDSTTNRALTAYPYLPSVFRPLFTNDN